MPYKDDGVKRLAAKERMRKYRSKGVTDVTPEGDNVTPAQKDSSVTPVTPEDKYVTLDSVLKLMKPLLKRVSDLENTTYELTNKLEDMNSTSVDWSKVRKMEKEDKVATESGICPKHGRIRIQGKPSCC